MEIQVLEEVVYLAILVQEAGNEMLVMAVDLLGQGLLIVLKYMKRLANNTARDT